MANARSRGIRRAALLLGCLAFSTNGVCQQAPLSGVEVATAGKITSYRESGQERAQEQAIMLWTTDPKAFVDGNPDLTLIAKGTRDLLAARTRGLMKITFVGVLAGKTADLRIIYLGTATAAGRWVLKSEFELQGELASIRSIRPDRHGLEVLSKRKAYLAAQRSILPGAMINDANFHPDLANTFRRQIEANMNPILGMLRLELNALPGDEEGLARFPELYREITTFISEFTTPDAAKLAAIKEEAKVNLHKRAFLNASAKIRSADIAWRTAPTVRESFARLGAALKAAGDEAGASKLTGAIDQRIQAFVDGLGSAALKSELAALPPDWDGIEKVIGIADDLEKAAEKETRLATLRAPLHGRAAELAAAREAEFLSSLPDYGPHYSEVPFLIEDADEEAAHFRAIGADAAADKILTAAVERAGVIVEGSRRDFATELADMNISRETVAELAAQAQAFDVMGELVEGYKGYAELTRKRLEVVKTELGALALKRAGLPKEAASLPLFDGKGGMALGEFIDLADASGNRVTEVSFSDRANAAARPLMAKVPAAIAGKTLTGIKVTLADETKVFIKFREAETPKGWVFVGEGRASGDGLVEPIAAAEWQRLRTTIAKQPPTGIIGSDGFTEADHLAAEPGDPQGVTPGVALEALDVEAALEASIAALERNPEQPRFQFYCGRILLAAGENESAEVFLRAAAQQNYAAASVALGEIELAKINLEGDESLKAVIPKLENVLTYFNAASAQKHRVASARAEEISKIIDSTKAALAQFTPPFDAGYFNKPNALKAIYNLDWGYLAGLNNMSLYDKQAIRPMGLKFYLSGLTEIIARRIPEFKDSALRKSIYELMPLEAKQLSPGDLQGKTGNQLWGLIGTGMLYNGLALEGNEDAEYLLPYFEDRDERTRFFENVLAFLKKY